MYREHDRDSIIRKNRELGAVLDVSMVLTASFVPEDNLRDVMSILANKLDMQRGCLFLLDRKTGEISIAAAHGLSPDEINKGRYRMGEGIVGKVLESGSEMFVPDIGDEPQFLNRTGSRLTRDGVSFICVPIKLDAELFGVITVDRIYSDEHGNVEDDLRVLRIVSSQIAQFLKLWELYQNAEREKSRLEVQLKDRYSLPNIIGESEKFQSVLKTVVKVAGTDATVLLLGESGTGKELIARTLHYQSRRAEKPYIAVNCAALPANLIEAELFGAERGAYTGANTKRIGRFESAEGGTIFLDEIGEIPIDVQAKLLRVLQERVFERIGSSRTIRADVRIITATNRDLEAEVAKGNFREDLYWRLNVVPVMLPPLRERSDDIPPLVTYYCEKFCREYFKDISVSSGAMEALSRYDWPGNVRELANAIERLVIMAEGNVIDAEMLPLSVRRTGGQLIAPSSEAVRNTGLGGEVETLEKEKIMAALKAHNFVQIHAARALGITPRQLGYRVKKYGIAV